MTENVNDDEYEVSSESLDRITPIIPYYRHSFHEPLSLQKPLLSPRMGT